MAQNRRLDSSQSLGNGLGQILRRIGPTEDLHSLGQRQHAAIFFDHWPNLLVESGQSCA